jgi:hypothetical protein
VGPSLFFFDVFSLFLSLVLKSKTFDDSELMELIDPDLLKQSIKDDAQPTTFAEKLKHTIAKGIALVKNE